MRKYTGPCYLTTIAIFFTDCNNDIDTSVTGHRGVIESPNFPNQYPHDRDCTWTIKAPLGNAINISFSHFEVEDPLSGGCEYDFVEVCASRNICARYILTSALFICLRCLTEDVSE